MERVGEFLVLPDVEDWYTEDQAAYNLAVLVDLDYALTSLGMVMDNSLGRTQMLDRTQGYECLGAAVDDVRRYDIPEKTAAGVDVAGSNGDILGDNAPYMLGFSHP